MDYNRFLNPNGKINIDEIELAKLEALEDLNKNLKIVAKILTERG